MIILKLEIAFIFLIISIGLYIVRILLVTKINQKDILIASSLIIGMEEIQEDDIGISETKNGTLAVLADGLGKKEAGRISSVYAVKEINEMFRKEGSDEREVYFFKKAYNKANNEIIKRVERDKGGASVLSCIIKDGYMYYALVGDAMLCIYRKNELYKISKGHSIDQVAKKRYENGKMQKERAVSVIKDKKLIYYLGNSFFENLENNKEPIKLFKGDIVVLMSKGVHKGIKWIDLEGLLSHKKKITDICTDIICRVNKENNGSIILMKYIGNK